jgi:hypothetical protein
VALQRYCMGRSLVMVRMVHIRGYYSDVPTRVSPGGIQYAQRANNWSDMDRRNGVEAQKARC